jgi:hypothetical protein
MSINKFNTNLDLARQAEIYSGETACFQGGMEMGIPFSGFPAGVDTNSIVSLGVTQTQRTTLSGSSATTIFDVSNLSSPSYNPTHTTLRNFPYSELDTSTGIQTGINTGTTAMSYTANTVPNFNPTDIIWSNSLLEKVYNVNNSGTTYPNNYFTQLFDNIGSAITGTTIELDESEYYQLENNNSVYSGTQFNIVVYEQGVHGSFPTLVTGSTSGTVIEYSATSYFWADSQFLTASTGLTTPITPLSSDTQTTDYEWTLTQSTIIDGNTIGLQYTGFNYTYSFSNVADVSTGTTPEYHGVVNVFRENFSAGTLDYKGDLTWLNVKGNANIVDRTTTNYMTIKSLGTGTPVTMLAVDSSGNVVGGSGGTTDDTGAFTSTTANNTIQPTNNALNNNVIGNHSTIAGGGGNYIGSISTYSSIGGGYGNVLSGGSAFVDTAKFLGGGFYNKIIGAKTGQAFIGSGLHNHIYGADHGVIAGGQYNTIDNGDDSVIGGGSNNAITGTTVQNSFIGGGQSNTIEGGSSIHSVIVGGLSNTVTGSSKSSIVGGGTNQINSTSYGHIGGGNGNLIHGSNNAFIGAGYQNSADTTSTNAVVVGGYGNRVGFFESTAGNGFIGGGSSNRVGGGWSAIVGGYNNQTLHRYSFIGGGYGNYIRNTDRAVIVGGTDNTIYAGGGSTNIFIGGGSSNAITGNSSTNSMIVGGQSNLIEGGSSHSMIVGGRSNSITGVPDAVIVGGNGNSTDSRYSFIGGGRYHAIASTGTHNSILGGRQNRVFLGTHSYNSIGGGSSNYVQGGSRNTIGGGGGNRMVPGGFDPSYSTIAGGGQNRIYSSASFIGGGRRNRITQSPAGAWYNTIAGGTYNRILNGGYSTITAGGFFYEQGSGPNPPYGNLSGNKIENSYWSFIGGGSNNLISGGTYVSYPGNFTVDANFSSIIAGSGNTAYHRNVHLIGMNLTSISADTTYVENLNIGKFDGGSIQHGLGVDSNGMVITGATGGGFTGNTSGSCITDLYLTNLYGCSPITIHDTILSNGNIIDSASTNTFIFGDSHTFTASTLTHGTGADANTILGGSGNKITPFQTGLYNAIIGGHDNEIGQVSRSDNNIILGSTNSLISGSFGAIGGSSILGGDDSYIEAAGNASIIGGTGNHLTSSAAKSVILGGQNITGDTANTVYVPNFNIETLGTGTSVNNLGIDANGNVVTGTAGGGVSEAQSATTTTVDFTGTTIYYSAGSEATGNISENLTGAKLGLIQKIYHNDTSEPTYPAGWVLMGDAIYVTSTLNIIYAEWAGGSRVEYWYVQEQ